MRQRWQLGYGLLFALLAGCGEIAAVSFADACQASNNGQRIRTEGYLVVGLSIFCSNISSSTVQCGLDFVAEPSQNEGFTADINEGTGKNQIVVPEDYTKETIVVHDAAGAVVKLGEKVQLEGTMLVGEACLIKVETIIRLP
ncbi:hypothetical protein [Herpetosiphon geysericola]|uniref:Lipoprotein n=1 Tax=Herpetosiphon geysericola TaxID=70996 RepID=A0A0P6Y540_9CHLR|nr:hypothetical protein [Herpetosiphon geysericola]KPL91333.1 hypothetical protein SE18_02595 [Herpetosiphon geysericola]